MGKAVFISAAGSSLFILLAITSVCCWSTSNWMPIGHSAEYTPESGRCIIGWMFSPKCRYLFPGRQPRWIVVPLLLIDCSSNGTAGPQYHELATLAFKCAGRPGRARAEVQLGAPERFKPARTQRSHRISGLFAFQPASVWPQPAHSPVAATKRHNRMARHQPGRRISSHWPGRSRLAVAAWRALVDRNCASARRNILKAAYER